VRGSGFAPAGCAVCGGWFESKARAPGRPEAGLEYFGEQTFGPNLLHCPGLRTYTERALQVRFVPRSDIAHLPGMQYCTKLFDVICTFTAGRPN
jgi:hypothetical protein